MTDDRTDRLPSTIAVLIMVVSLIAAGFAYLQTQSDNRAAIAGRRAEAEAVQVLSQLAIQEREIAHQVAIFGYSVDLAWMSAELGEISASGLDYAAGVGTALSRGFNESSSFSSVFGSEYQRADGLVEWARFVEEQRRPVYRALEVQSAQGAVADAWGGKAAKYIAIITVLAAAVFLLGLASSISVEARRILAFSGAGLALLASVWGVTVALADVPRVSERSIDAYVDGFTINLWAQERADWVFSERRFTEAIGLDPGYRNAYFGRGVARFQLDLLDPTGPKGSAGAEADFRKFLEFDDQSGIAWGNLGAIQFWTGDYEAAHASTVRALEFVPDDPTFALNLGLLLAIGDDPAAYADQLTVIRGTFVDLPAWLRETVVSRYMLPLDLAEAHRPELAASVREFRENVVTISHEISVGRRFFGGPTPEPITTAIPAMTLTALDDGTRIRAEFTYQDSDASHRWMYRTYVNRVEVATLSRVPEPWTLDVPDGVAIFDITHPSGLRGTTVRVEIFIEGNLVAAAEVAVP